MARRVSIRHKRKEAPEWVFQWRPRGESYVPKLLALVFVAILFVLLISSVKIRVSAPTPWAAKKAAVILAANDADSRALTLRAREGGPFPSRFEPGEWQAVRELEQSAFAAARWTPPAYQPALRPLPEASHALPLLVDQGEPVLPRRRAESAESPTAKNLRPTPVLEPLSGIDRDSLPKALPSFDGVVDAALTSETWRFLVRLGPGGEVVDCVSLTGGDEKQQALLATWLRQVVFNQDAKPDRWISVAVTFLNQEPNPPSTPADGTLDR
jgi:hypothetical protein